MDVFRKDELPRGGIARELAGGEHGLDVALLVVDAEPGRGPGPHRHPYPEVFVMVEGTATFTVDGEVVEAAEGDIVVARAGEAHSFVNSGSGILRQVNIHLGPAFVTEWLDDTQSSEATAPG